MKKSKKNTEELTDKIKISIIIIIITVFVVLASIAYRKSTYTQTWLVCDKDINQSYHDVIKFRYDINDKLYGYYREETIHDISNEYLEANYEEYKKQYDQVKDSLSDNYQYELNKSSDSLLVKTYIGVSVNNQFFNKYIKALNESINSTSKIGDVKDILESNSYKCEVTRK